MSSHLGRAHIATSATQLPPAGTLGGPRGQFIPGTTVKVSDVSNGIWLCDNHHTLVDQQRGVDFPPFVLKAWKKLHETRLAFNWGTPMTGFGWLHALEVLSCPFLPTTTFEFGPATVISGPNGSGKTQLLKLLTSTQAKGFSAWAARGGIECKLQWFDACRTSDVNLALDPVLTLSLASQRIRRTVL
jgi:hypothetical protein